MNYLDEMLKRFRLSNIRTLILVTNCLYITVVLLKMYKSNSEYFFENAFQTVNLFFYLYVLLSYILIKNIKLYFLSSFLLILDLPVDFKPRLQNFLIHYLNPAGILNHRWAIPIVLLIVLMVFAWLIYKYNAVQYLQIFLFFFYLISLVMIVLQPQKIYDTTLHISYRVSTVSKNYYFLMFDEYPAEQIIKKYGLADKDDYPSAVLNKEGFTADTGFYSNYISTVRSTTNFLTGRFQAKYSVNSTIRVIQNNIFTNGLNYSFNSFSIFDDQNRPNSLFSRYYFYNFNNLLTSKIIPYIESIFSKRGAGDYTDCDAYNADAVTKLDALSKTGQAHVVFIHFFTPHYYPLVNGQPIAGRIRNADGWMQKAINALNLNDPKAGIIIFSDHGLRTQNIPLKLRNKNILYYRNVVIDTNLVNQNGLVDLAKSINY